MSTFLLFIFLHTLIILFALVAWRGELSGLYAPVTPQYYFRLRGNVARVVACLMLFFLIFVSSFQSWQSNRVLLDSPVLTNAATIFLGLFFGFLIFLRNQKLDVDAGNLRLNKLRKRLEYRMKARVFLAIVFLFCLILAGFIFLKIV